MDPVLAAIPVEKTAKSKSHIAAIVMGARIAGQYADADDAEKKAAAVKEKYAGELKEKGLDYVIRENCQRAKENQKLISSIYLCDAPQHQAPQRVLFTWTRKQLSFKPNVARELFDGFDVDPMHYLCWQVNSEFNSEALMTNGRFDSSKYLAFKGAIDKVAESLGIESPFECSKVLTAKGDFHERRFTDFSVAQNMKIAEIVPTSTTLEPVRPESQ